MKLLRYDIEIPRCATAMMGRASWVKQWIGFAVSLLGLALPLGVSAADPVEMTGRVEMRAPDCFSPEPNDHSIEYFLLDVETQVQTRLTGDAELLSELTPHQQIRVIGTRSPQSEASIAADAQIPSPLASSPPLKQEVQVESIEFLPVTEGAEAVEPPTVEGANSLEMLSCLLIFASTNSDPCMTSVSNATGLLFDNATNANEGMQAITKGRYGLQLGNGTGVPEDHIIEITLDINSAGYDSDSMETAVKNAVFNAAPNGLGINRYAYNRVLIFHPGGISDAGFTAFGYYGPFNTTSTGMITVYGNSYGNNRMNGYLHELGHNFGFRHSSKGGSEYGDRTCVMGLSNDGTKSEAYGAVKLLQTNWLDTFPDAEVGLTTDMTLDLYPLSSDPNVVTEPIAVSIPGTDYTVAYHRDDRPYGYLSQSGDRDRVFVYTNASSSSVSFQVANLSEGETFSGPVEVTFGAYGSSNAYATVSIDVDDGNTMPEVTEVWGTGQNQGVVLNFPATDADGDTITYATVANPANGQLSGSYPNLTYTPDTDYIGSDTFRITASDALISNFITITVLTFVDSDTDGLDDDWENQYFGDLSQEPAGNPDNDQENNLTEFQNDTDPTRAPTLYSEKLTGTVIGTPGSYANDPAWDKDEAHDGNLNTFYDAANANGDWTGLDLGSAQRIGLIKYAPRSTWPARMNGGKFQGSNTSDFSSGVVTFYTISGSPTVGSLTEQDLNDAGTYRYVRYLSPDGGYCNIAEVEFWQDGAPDAPTGLSATNDSGAVDLDWDNSTDVAFDSYNVYRGTISGVYDFTPIATGLTQSQYSDTSVASGTTYYYVVAAVDSDGLVGPNSAEASIAYVLNNFAPVANAGPDQSTSISGGAAWTPAQISTAGWYDASDAGTITESGGAVSQWNDKSGNDLHLQAAGGQEPLTGSTSINGTNAIDFDGSNDQMSTSSNPFGAAVNDALVIMVHQVDNDSDQGTIFTLTGSDASGSRWQSHAPYNGTAYFDCGGTGGANRINQNYGTNTGDNVLLGFYGSTTDNVQQIYKNGTLLVGDASGHSVNTAGNIFVGSGASSSYQDTTIGELIIVNGTVSLEDRQKLEGYLAHKWGLAGSLPSEHPYKAAAPGGSGASVDLNGGATDADGNPLTTTWTKVSGTGSVSFSNAAALNATAYFSEADTYVLRLTADDGVFQNTDDITITVTSSSDSDGDGMDDSWETTNFGDLTQGADDDFDSDGETNLTEFTNGSDPTVDSVAPAAPLNLTPSVGDGYIDLDWDDNAESDLNSYSVYRSTTAGSGFTLLQSGVGVSAYQDNAAVNGTTYYYVVKALDNTANASDDSNEVSGTPVGGLLVSEGPSGLVYETYANEGQTNAVNTVPDFSRAGYQGGGVEIPFVPAAVTLSPSGGDDTTAIQNAINTVSAMSLVDGFRGAVLLTAGEYTVSSTLNINASGVIIRGEGQQDVGGTRVTYTATTQSDLFHFHGSSNPSYVGSSARPITDAYVPVGSKTLNISDAAPYAPGDLIRITNLVNQQWIDDIGMTEAGGLAGGLDDPAWEPADFQLQHYRYIVAVNGNELTLDAPIVQAIETQYGGGEVRKYTYTEAIENVGIENIRLESAYTADDDEDHGWVAIEMRRVKNGWARQITSRYFGMGLILVDDFSQFITVEDSACLDPKSITTGGRKYSFNVDDSTYNLVQRTLSKGARHDYASGSLTPGPNVFVDSLAVQSNADIGPHFRYATGELYDNIKTDTEINVQNRLNAGTSHGWSGAQIMFWNVEANSIISDAPTGAMNWSIGAVGTKSDSPSFMSPWEPFGIWQSHNAHVAPRSLYYAQLEDRLGAGAVNAVMVPEQKSGTIWTELQTWNGDGLFLDGVVCWIADDATLEIDTAMDIGARLRDLGIMENLSSTTWSKVSGPGAVTFGDDSLLATTASFDQQGTYVIQLTADDGSQQISGSIELVITDPNYVAPPLTPTNLTVSVNDGSVDLDWDDNAETGVTYTVSRSTTAGSGYTVLQADLATSAYTDNSVSNGTTYYYIVTASVPGSAESESSGQQSALPNAAPAFDSDPMVETGATEDAVYSSSIADNASDGDEDNLAFSLVSGPDWLAVATNGDLSGTPDSSDLDVNEWTVQVDDTNGGSVQATLRITVANADPDALSGLSASAGNNTVTLNWPDSAESDFASYSVYRSTTPGSGYTSIATGLTTSAHDDDTANNGTTYYYVVRVVDVGALESGNSNEVSATPEAPILTQVVATDNSFIQASGTDSVQDSSSTFGVNRGTFIYGARQAFIRIPLSGDDQIGGVNADEIASVSFDLFATDMISNDTVNVYALLDDVQFSENHLSESSWTGGAAGTQATGGNLTPNNRPDGGGVPNGYTTGSLGSITFPASPTNYTLQQISITDLDAFKDLIRNDTNGEITLILQGSANSPVNSFISVFNSGSNPKPTLSIERQVGPTIPLAPSNLAASGGDSLVSLTWTDNSDNESGFIIQRSTTSGNGFTTITTTAADATSYSDTGLAAGTEYFYQVIATNAAGDSAASSEASATTWSPSESWRDEYFGDTGNTGDAADENDFDGDGVANILERAFGTAPNDSDSVKLPTSAIMDDGGTDYPSISYRRLKGGTGTTGVDYTVDGLVYTVEYDTDLVGPWNSGSVVQVGSAVDNGDGTETVTVRVTSAVATESKQFIRVKVVATP